MMSEPPVIRWTHYGDVTQEVLDAAIKARQLHPRGMASAQEGYAVILRELDELWDEVRKHRAVILEELDKSLEHLAAMRKGAIRVAAMGLAFVVEVCDAQ